MEESLGLGRQKKLRHQNRYGNSILVSVADTETRFWSYTTCITYIVCTAMPAVFIPTCELHCRCMSTKSRCKNSSLRSRNFFFTNSTMVGLFEFCQKKYFIQIIFTIKLKGTHQYQKGTYTLLFLAVFDTFKFRGYSIF